MRTGVFILLFFFAFSLAAQDGPTVGSRLRSLSGKDLVTGKMIDIEFASSPAYTLFHFWQSSSEASIKSFAAVQKLVKENKEKLVAYGFPYEFRQNIPKAKELIAAHQLVWPQLLQYKQTNAAGANVIDALVIKEFPTYLLLDREGVILVRSNTLGDVQALLDKLK